MAHYAEIDAAGIVLRVIVVPDEAEADGEAAGAAWCSELLGGRWVKTSYNARNNGYRRKFAGPGDYWDSEAQVFRRPAPPAKGTDGNDANG